jgi:hypothetical protein
MKTVKAVRTIEKVISVCSWFVFMVFLTTTVSVFADHDADDAPNLGMRTIRITSLCSSGSPIISGISEGPPPASEADPNWPTVPTQATSAKQQMELRHQLVQSSNPEVLLLVVQVLG